MRRDSVREKNSWTNTMHYYYYKRPRASFNSRNPTIECKSQRINSKGVERRAKVYRAHAYLIIGPSFLYLRKSHIGLTFKKTHLFF